MSKCLLRYDPAENIWVEMGILRNRWANVFIGWLKILGRLNSNYLADLSMFHFEVRWFKENNFNKDCGKIKQKIKSCLMVLLFLLLQNNKVWLKLWEREKLAKSKINQENKVCPGCCEWDAHCHGRMGGDDWSLMIFICDNWSLIMDDFHMW